MKYEVRPPVKGGYDYWDVIEPNSNVMQNFAVASFSVHCPDAEKEARGLCVRLNAK